MTELLHVKNLQKSYGGAPVLDVPDLSFAAGERCALIGQNGSGKSTLLGILAGTLAPDRGEVSRCGGLGYLPQTPYAFDLSVLKNVALSGCNREEAQNALAALAMEQLAARRGSRLSGGEKGRMALARLTARPHPALLLDEPTAAMDVEGEELAEAALLRYQALHGALLLFSTHSPAQALRLAGRVILLQNGRIVEDGAAEEVLLHPISEAGRRFLAHWRI